ncbi:uncharacterized protein RSE6_02299 [Rhynchosporium secalis]|uniref:Uncharacterized protein n=1 Tax=Rhynchosporium secalis TaxID=38038 RepID=A0A1E1LZW5_RHYSE|nr:uncharacterized protein RSE6_02299 [Rhynchosporium secalis]
MDSVRKTQTIFDSRLIDEMNYSDEVYWVEAAWRLEDVPQDSGEDWMDCARCVEVNLEVDESLSDPAESTPEILLKGDKKQDNPSTSYEDGIIMEERADIRSSVSRKSYKCGLGCSTLAFKWPKDLRRYIKDIHETTAQYRCTAADYEYGDYTVCYPIKRKDNFRRHLQKKHNFQSADLLHLDLDSFLV